MTDFSLIISPNQQMLFHANLLLWSMRNIKDCTYTLTVGPQDLADRDLIKLKKACPVLKINPYKTSRYGFDPPYLGGHQRWDLPFEGDVTAFIDVDGIVCGDLSFVIDACKKEQKVMGVRNIGSPFRFKPTPSVDEWARFEKMFGIKFRYVHHNGVNISQFDPKHYWIPDVYFNYGFMLIPKAFRAAICQEIPNVIQRLERYEKNFWNGEMALCIIIQMLNIPVAFLEQKYNYPDRIEFFNKVPCDDIRFLHMVRKTIKSESDLSKPAVTKVEKFIQNKVKDIYNRAISLI